MDWIVYAYRIEAGKFVCHAYGSFDNSGGAAAGKPWDEATAKAYAANITANLGGDANPWKAMALPLEQTLQPGV